MTKRIKITEPKDLREGMRVEVDFKNHGLKEGKVYKPNKLPYCRQLCLNGSCFDYLFFDLVSRVGEMHKDVCEIHRLIDGIEDVVVGDELWMAFVKIGEVKEKLGKSIYVYNYENESGQWMPIDQAKREGWAIDIPKEEPQKTELTETEAKEIIAEQKGVEPEDIVIKNDE